MDKKNTMLLTVIAVATLLVVVVGATFAYFTVSQSEAQQTVVTGNIGGDKIGTITLTGGQPLFLEVSAAEMAITAKGTDYYTVGSAEARNTTKLNQAVKSTYTATLVQDDDATGSYTCTWKFNVNATGTMTEALNAGDIDFVVNNNGAETIHKLDSKDDFAVLEGTWSGITGNSASRYLSAYVVLHNTEDPAGQNSLAGTGLELTITPAEFVCSPEEPSSVYNINVKYEDCDFEIEDMPTTIKKNEKVVFWLPSEATVSADGAVLKSAFVLSYTLSNPTKDVNVLISCTNFVGPSPE